MRTFLNRNKLVSSTDVVGATMITQRALLKALRTHGLTRSGLKPETAEILIELFLADRRLSSLEHTDGDGSIGFRELRESLSYSAGLFSRRITWLCEHGWAEAARIIPSASDERHGNSQKIKITPAGSKKIAPVWERYQNIAERLLDGLSPADVAAHYRVNEIIVDRLRGPKLLWQDPARTLNPSKPRRAADIPHRPHNQPFDAKSFSDFEPPVVAAPEPEKEFLD